MRSGLSLLQEEAGRSQAHSLPSATHNRGGNAYSSKEAWLAMLRVLRALAHEKVNYFQKGNRKHVQGEKTEVNIGETEQAEVVASC